MLKRALGVILSAILIATLAIGMVGCKKVSEDEAVSIVKDLVSRSYELNDIYFGKGLKYVDSGNPNDVYLPVRDDERYVLRSELIEATHSVFSESYALSIIEGAFNGVSTDISIAQSRYMVDDGYEMILVNKNYNGVAKEITEYDYNTIEITKISRRFIEATIKSTKGEIVNVSLVKENSGWRLNSGTC